MVAHIYGAHDTREDFDFTPICIKIDCFPLIQALITNAVLFVVNDMILLTKKVLNQCVHKCGVKIKVLWFLTVACLTCVHKL